MSRSRYPLRPAALAGTLAISALALSGCGVNTSDSIAQSDRRAASERQTQERQTAETRAARRSELPTRPDGTVAVAVPSRTSIVGRAAIRADDADPTVEYDLQIADDIAAARDLCAGRVDLAQISRPLTKAELAVCASNGLSVGKPLTLGYTVAILVTRNGTDIGGDCLTLGSIQSLLAVNSTVVNWNQIGFGDYPFAVAGPPASSSVMTPITRLALRLPDRLASQSDLRTGMLTFTDQSDIGAFIAGTDRRDALNRHVRQYVRRLTTERRAAEAQAIARAEREAARRVVRKINAENRARAARGESVADPEALAARNAQRVAEAKRKAVAQQRAVNRREIQRLERKHRAEQLPSYLGDGRLAIVGYPYYEAHSDVLRPLEIDPRVRTAAGSKPDCRFPSQHSISNGSYPLALPVFLYGDTRTLRSTVVRPLLRSVLDNNAELTRVNDAAGLSPTAINDLRRNFGLETESPSGTSTSPRNSVSPTSPVSPITTATSPAPSPAPGGVPGVDAPQATP